MEISSQYINLRKLALSLNKNKRAKELKKSDKGCLATAMEIKMNENYAFVVGVMDGGASIYFSNGSGILGTTDTQALSPKIQWMLSRFETQYESFQEEKAKDLPDDGQVKFYWINEEKVIATEAPLEALEKKENDLWPLYQASHELISAVRIAGESKQNKGQKLTF
jgi:hypothetical protein